jgi:hypothetical protein
VKVVYTDKAKQWSEGYDLVHQATKHLEEILGQSTDLVTVEWDRSEDSKGRLVYVLRLSDYTGWVTGIFTPEELQSYTRTTTQLYRLWGDLLQVRSHRQLEELLGSEGSGK